MSRPVALVGVVLAVLSLGACSGGAPEVVRVTETASPAPQVSDDGTPVDVAGTRLQTDIKRVLDGKAPLYPANGVERTGESADPPHMVGFAGAVVGAIDGPGQHPAKDLTSIGYGACDLIYLSDGDISVAIGAITVEGDRYRSQVGAIFMESAARALCTEFESDFDDWIASEYGAWNASL